MLSQLLFLATLCVSLSATSYEDSRLLRRDVLPVDGIHISNRNLFVLPRSNTSHTDKRELDDHRLEHRAITKGIVRLTANKGRYTGTVSFKGMSVSGVVFDTGSRTTWAQMSANPSSKGTALTFYSMGFLQLHGYMLKGTVQLQRGLTSDMKFATVHNGQQSNGYSGGLGLNRAPESWPNLLINRIPAIFAFYVIGNHAEFDFGEIDPKYQDHIEWHLIDPSLSTWTIQNAHVKVNGQVVTLDHVSTTIHTGVRYIYGSTSIVDAVYKTLEGARKYKGFWMVPCDNPPLVSFSWGGRDTPIHDFLSSGISSAMEDGKHYCRGAIRPHNGLPPNTFGLGSSFLDGKYVAFHEAEKKVGFLTMVAPSHPSRITEVN